jgi:Xaa-Pro aminopeptidase
MTDFAVKQARLRELMGARGLPSLLLTSQVNFAWLTGGRGHILLASEGACGGLLLTPDRTYLVTNNIEARRLLDEEMPGLALPVLETAWDSGRSPLDIAGDLTGGTAPRSDQEPDILVL